MTNKHTIFYQSNCEFYQSKGLVDWSLDEPMSLSVRGHDPILLSAW